MLLWAVLPSQALTVTYARNFSVRDLDGCRLVTVSVPYYGAVKPAVTLLVPRGRELWPSVPDATVVFIPLERVVVGTTPAVACLEALNGLDTLVGLAGGRYVYTRSVQAMELPEVASDGGMSRVLDRERLLDLAPDGFVTYIYGDEEQRDVDFLRRCGVPVLLMAEYLETSPLGRAEWIKFVGMLVGKEAEAERLFDEVAARYGELEALVRRVSTRPRILTGIPYAGTWYVPRGDSWPARLFRAAGAASLWDDLKGTGTAPLDLEAVIHRAVTADLWLNCENWRSLSDASGTGLPLEAIPAFRRGAVYNNDRRVNDQGGNDYYQSGVIRPDLILADLVSIVHPELSLDHEPTFYRRLP